LRPPDWSPCRAEPQRTHCDTAGASSWSWLPGVWDVRRESNIAVVLRAVQWVAHPHLLLLQHHPLSRPSTFFDSYRNPDRPARQLYDCCSAPSPSAGPLPVRWRTLSGYCSHPPEVLDPPNPSFSCGPIADPMADRNCFFSCPWHGDLTSDVAGGSDDVAAAADDAAAWSMLLLSSSARRTMMTRMLPPPRRPDHKVRVIYTMWVLILRQGIRSPVSG